jgi:hypothetical protein
MRNLEKQNLKKVSWSQISTSIFNDNERSIHVEFYLEGEDILSYVLNKTVLSRTYSANTNWIKFECNLTSTVTLNFATYFATPTSSWQKTNYTASGIERPAVYYNSTVGAAPFDAMCYFILPATTINIRGSGNILIFDIPLPFEDKFIDSPILILGAIIIANAFFIVYRKVRK